jgi:hypothetical protein
VVHLQPVLSHVPFNPIMSEGFLCMQQQNQSSPAQAIAAVLAVLATVPCRTAATQLKELTMLKLEKASLAA